VAELFDLGAQLFPHFTKHAALAKKGNGPSLRLLWALIVTGTSIFFNNSAEP
jgi:hypothetical protein